MWGPWMKHPRLCQQGHQAHHQRLQEIPLVVNQPSRHIWPMLRYVPYHTVVCTINAPTATHPKTHKDDNSHRCRITHADVDKSARTQSGYVHTTDNSHCSVEVTGFPEKLEVENV